MTERKYTVREIDALRHAVDTHYMWGVYRLSRAPRDHTVNVNTNAKEIAVEERVRTYMLAGITADDLYRDEDERYEKIAAFAAKGERDATD